MNSRNQFEPRVDALAAEISANAKLDGAAIEKFLQSGNAADLNDLFCRHIATVHSLAFKMTCNRAAADDVTQEVFLKAVSSLRSFNHRAAFSTWLYRIALNTTYSWLKKSAKQNEPQNDESLSVNHADSGETRPDQPVLQTELEDEIDKAILTLKPEMRAAIVLTAIDRLTPGEAAKVVDCTPATFYWRLHTARQQLKQQLAQYLETDETTNERQ